MGAGWGPAVHFSTAPNQPVDPPVWPTLTPPLMGKSTNPAKNVIGTASSHPSNWTPSIEKTEE